MNAVEAGVDSIEHCTFADDAVLAAHRRCRHVRRADDLRRRAAVPRPPRSSPRMPAHLRQRMAEFNDVHLATIRRAHELGARIAMGTDAGTPGNHHGLNAHECVFMSTHCGLSPAESIRTATIERRRAPAARGRARRARRGRLRRRHRLRGDPLDDIEELTRLTFVMKGGQVVRDDRT